MRIRFAVCVYASVLLAGCASPSPSICFEAVCYQAEIADNDAERKKGLMFRDHLGADQGMLFIFDSVGEYPFWMKNTKIPLDMIWLDQNLTVRSIRESVPPCLKDPCPMISPNAEALYVLELNAGEVKKLGLKVGDQAVWQ
jgi:uncharacterized membrane protein (UPF0127 family)